MKSSSLIAVLAVSTVLTSCSSSGGGGYGNVPNTTLPNVVNPTAYNAQITSMQATDETNTKALVEYSEKNTPATLRLNKRMMAVRSSETEIDQTRIDAALAKFENMHKVLIKQDFEGCTIDSLREAISLSGYDVGNIPDDVLTFDDIKTWVEENIDELSLKAQRIYDMYGEVKNIAQDNAIINVVNIDAKQDSYVSFKLKDDGSIEKLYFDVDIDSSDARRTELTSSGNGIFINKKPNYVYSVRLKNGPEVYIEDFNTLEYTKNHWNEFIGKLQANLQEQIADSNYTPDQKAAFEEEINGLTFEGDFAANKCETGKCTEDKTIYYAGSDNVETKVTYESKAKNSGLQYSDFGTVLINGMEGFLPVNETFVFAGGMAAKRIDETEIQGDMTFTGNAVATVIHQDYTGEEREENTKTFDGSANLVFNDGAETLTTKFDNWYDVTVTSNANQDNYNITFENNTMSEDDKNYYQFNRPDEFTENDFVGGSIEAGSYGAVDIGYYGENGTPEEATGFVAYGENIVNNVTLNAQIGFGAVRQ